MTIGEDRVRIKFNPSENTLVADIKERAAELIDLCATSSVGRSPEEKRLYALAMTQFEEGAMWATKAATTP